MFKMDESSLEYIRSLADIITENKLEKIEIKDGETEIVITKHSCPPPPHNHHMPPPPPMFSAQPAMPQMVSETPVMPVATAESKPSGNAVKAPIVGTFYSKPAPEKEPFVKVGDTVKKGDVIMIIESMKLMNEVTSEFDGQVKEILVKDGEAVEYDQPVMIIG